MVAAPLIELRGVTLEVAGRRFLDAADLSVARGETVAVFGPPGCGKSFVLRLLLGLPGMDAQQIERRGEVLVEGERVFELGGADLQRLRRRIGFVMQGGGLIENMDIRRNVTLPILYHHRDALPDPSLADRRCDALLDRFGVRDLGLPGLRPVSLDATQRTYVALARAMIAEPFLLLLDDPASGLSPEAARQLCEHAFADPSFDDLLPAAITGSVTRPVTRIVTSSDPARYGAHCDRFVLHSEGTLVSVGDRAALASSHDERVRSLTGPVAMAEVTHV